MRKKNYKGRCVKRTILKSKEPCRTYDDIQFAYLDMLNGDKNIKEIYCNVLLDDTDLSEYTTDFLCEKVDGSMMVRECVFRKFLLKPMTAKLLDMSKQYWFHKKIYDWGIVIDEEK